MVEWEIADEEVRCILAQGMEGHLVQWTRVLGFEGTVKDCSAQSLLLLDSGAPFLEVQTSLLHGVSVKGIPDGVGVDIRQNGCT